MPDFPHSIQDRHEQHCAWGERYEAACIREERFAAPVTEPDGPTDAELALAEAPAKTAAARAAWQALLADDPQTLSRKTAVLGAQILAAARMPNARISDAPRETAD